MDGLHATSSENQSTTVMGRASETENSLLRPLQFRGAVKQLLACDDVNRPIRYRIRESWHHNVAAQPAVRTQAMSHT